MSRSRRQFMKAVGTSSLLVAGATGTVADQSTAQADDLPGPDAVDEDSMGEIVEALSRGAVPRVLTFGHGDDRKRWRGFDSFFADTEDPFQVRGGPGGYDVELQYLANQRSRSIRYDDEERTEAAICTMNTKFLQTLFESEYDIDDVTISVWLLVEINAYGNEEFEIANTTILRRETAADINWRRLYDVDVVDPWLQLPEVVDEYEWEYHPDPTAREW